MCEGSERMGIGSSDGVGNRQSPVGIQWISNMENYRDLRVWQEAIALAERCYVVTRGIPNEEKFGLTIQIRRAVVSVSANIAKGWGRDSTGDYIRFLLIAQGSLKESESLAIVSTRVGCCAENDSAAILQQCGEVGKMLRGLIRSLQSQRSE